MSNIIKPVFSIPYMYYTIISSISTINFYAFKSYQGFFLETVDKKFGYHKKSLYILIILLNENDVDI